MKKAILIAILAGGVGVGGVLLVQQGIQKLTPTPASGPAGDPSAGGVAGAPSATGGPLATPGGGEAASGPSSAPADPTQQALTSAHEKAGVLAAEEVRFLLASRDYSKAAAQCRAAMRDYYDTAAGKDLPDLLAAAESGIAQQQNEQATEAEKQARHQRFLKCRQDAQDAIHRNDLPGAIQFLRNALGEEEDPEVRSQLEDLIEKTTKPRVGVLDFTTSGNVGIADAGKTVAELVLVQFPSERYQLVERSRLAELLKEKDLALADIVDNPGVLKSKGVRGVGYVVLGNVSKLGKLAVTARLVNVKTGEVVQAAEVTADTPAELQDTLQVLAAVLQMTSEEKAAFLKARADQEEAKRIGAARIEEERQDRIRREREGRKESARLMEEHVVQAKATLDAIQDAVARNDLWRADQIAAWAVEEFADTSYADSFTWQVQDVARRIEAQREAERQRRLLWEQHCNGAMMSLAAAKSKMSRRDYDKVIEICQLSLRDFGDTPWEPDFRRLMREAREQIEAMRTARDEAARRHLQEAADWLRQLQALMAAGEFEKAVQLAEKANRDYADTPTAPRLKDTLADARRRLAEQIAMQNRIRAHELEAARFLADLRAMISRKQFLQAVNAADAALRSYYDTAVAKDIVETRSLAQREVDKQRQAEAEAEKARQRHERFLKFRQDGMAAMVRKDYAAAVTAFLNALREEDDAATRRLLQDAQQLAKASPSPSPTHTPSLSPSGSPTFTPRPTGSFTPRPTGSGSPSPSPSPSGTPSPSPSASPTLTPLHTPSPSPSATASPSPSPTHTPGLSPSGSPTFTPRPTGSFTPRPTATGSPSPSPSPSGTPSPSPSASPTLTPLHTPSPSPTLTPLHTPSPSPSATASPSPSLTLSPRPTFSPRPTGSGSPSPSPSPSGTPSPSPSASPTLTPLHTPSPSPSATASPSPSLTLSPRPTFSPRPTGSGSPSPSPSPSGTPSPSPSASPTLTPLHTPSPSPSATASPSPSLTLSPRPTFSPRPTGSGSPSPSPSPSGTPSPSPSASPTLTPLHTPSPLPSVTASPSPSVSATPSAAELRKAKHEQDAKNSLAAIQALMTKKDYDKAAADAKAAAREFADTEQAKPLADILTAAQKALDAEKKAAAEAAAKAKHEQDARNALAAIQALMTKKDYDKAAADATTALRLYGDTAEAKALADALAAAQKADADEKRHERFLKLKQEGVAAMNRKDYAAAVTSFQNALKEEDDAATKLLLAEAHKLASPSPSPTRLLSPSPTVSPSPTRSTSPSPSATPVDAKPSVGFAEFQLSRTSGRPLVAAADVNEALAKRFPTGKYDVLGSKAFSDALAKAGLTPDQVAARPAVLAGKKVQGVDYIVTGVISTTGRGGTEIDAQLIDASTGRAVQTAKASLQKAADLDAALAEIVKGLTK